MARLKVYRTPIGFHDAYVAATSQKAALKAWGSDRDLFARGVAEVVTDPALAAEPLASPGTIVKRSRGTAAEQIAALPPDRATPKPKPRRAARDETPAVRMPPPPKPPPAPKPNRAALNAAEDALSQAEAQYRSDDRALRAEEAALAKRRRALERAFADTRERLETARQAAADAHDGAMRRWKRDAG